MSILSRILGLFLAVASGMIVAGIAVPVAWVVVRVLGLIPVLAAFLGRLDYLMWLGGVVFGVLAGPLAVGGAIRAMGENDRAAIAAGAIGGAVGGLASSIMFFPIVGLL
jgi:hypothetical protein